MRRTRITLAGLCLAAMLVACGDSGESTSTDSTYTYSSDVPGIELPMLSADFWIDRLGDDSQRLTARAITTFNTANFAGDPYLYDLTNFPDSLNHDQLLQLLDQVSRPSTSARYYENGSPVSDADYARLEASLQREAVPAEVPVRWGLVVQRDSLRTFPTRERVFKQTNDLDLDRFQETGVFPGQTLALLHESADGNWWFAVNYHYAAWVPKQSVAEGTRQEIEQWINRSLRLVVTGAQIKTNFNPVEPRTAQVLLDMGVTLPLMSSAEVGHNVNGQNPYASYVVSLPVRATNGELEFKPALIARSQDVRVGHLPYKPSLVLRQAFKFLGERYGWGHDYNARDCTGFVGEVYKSFGILMPRNSGQQGQSAFAPTQIFQPDAREEKALALEQLQVGDLIYIPGHVMMYIGHVDNEPYVIHDVTGLAYFDSSENFYRGTLSGVSVTPLTKLWLNPETNFVDRIYAIKSIH